MNPLTHSGMNDPVRALRSRVTFVYVYVRLICSYITFDMFVYVRPLRVLRLVYVRFTCFTFVLRPLRLVYVSYV